MKCRREFPLLAALSLLLPPAAGADAVISEFLARNETSLHDEDDWPSDWIEIANTGDASLNLEGWTLTDNPDRPRKWEFPAAVLAPGERRVVFASGKDRREPGGEWHASFQLSAAGEYLALVMPDGVTVASAFEPIPQFDDISFGSDGETGQPGYLDALTPGESNGHIHHPGPVIRDVAASPSPLESGQDLVVTARIAPRTAPIESAMLRFRIDYRGEGAASMRDDGTGNDTEAGDGIYTGTISGRTLFGPSVPPGHMLRWAVEAADVEGRESRLPVFLDQDGEEQSPQYFGTVTAAPEVVTGLPLFEWFTQNEAASNTLAGTRASVYFQGRFYDNIFVRQRGGATNGQSQKFDFSNAFPVYVNEAIPAARELNLNAQGSDPTYLRQTLAFHTYTWVGNASCESFLTLMRLNAEPDRTGVLIEQVDEVFLERHGFDPDGDLYKLVQRSDLQPVFADSLTGIEKESGDRTDLTTFEELVDGLRLTDEALTAFLFDSFNLPQVMNYLAVRSITQDADDVRKNFYVYKDTGGSGEWSIFPWDKDWTFGVTGDGGQHLKHPFFGDEAHRKDNALQWNKLYDALFGVLPTRDMYLRRLRTCMDAMLQPPGTPASESLFDARVDALFATAHGSNVPVSAPATVKAFFPQRRRDLYETYASLVPPAQLPSPSIEIGDIVFDPGSGDQNEEYIQLLNPGPAAVDISGWKLEGAVDFVFAEGTVIPAASLFSPGHNDLYVVPDVKAFRGRAESPKGGEGLFVQGAYNGRLSNRGETIVLRDATENLIAEKQYEGSGSPLLTYLFPAEFMYHPPDSHPDAEFIELFNSSETLTLDLSGAAFTDGIDFTFGTGVTLEPLGFLLVVLNRAAFEALYGPGLPIAGEFSGDTRLNNGGETLRLEDAQGDKLFEFSYGDSNPWPPEADGHGSSLELRDPRPGADPEDAASWGASAPNGTPGRGPDDSGDLIDKDHDGIVSLLEEWFGTSDNNPAEGPGALRMSVEGGSIALWSRRADPPANVTAALECSGDLSAWENCEDRFEHSIQQVDGQNWERWLLKDGVNLGAHAALRLRVAGSLSAN